ncbi:expressed protein [Phakopsora pachyrhizi]|uniref:Expressed protein n=1 Tax=Phakopsora pachyrhizi TaxID=170000 RepID=A0AAV0AIK7_PHAPC|nr:expressed protein [Phakopsora pachyrhizi]
MKTDGGFNKLSDNSRLLIVTLSVSYSISLQLLLSQRYNLIRSTIGPIPLSLNHQSTLSNAQNHPYPILSVLIHLVWESVLIKRLSDRPIYSLVGCLLHLISLPLLTIVYGNFLIGDGSEILNLMTFKILNYLGQVVIFKLLTKTKEPTSNLKNVDSQITGPIRSSTVPTKTNGKESGDDSRIVRKSRKEMQVKVLSWILISIIDGLVGYILLKGFNRVIGGDLNGYFKRIEIDEFFMLKPSSTGLDQRLRGILEKLSKDENKSMRNLQLISPIVNLPYLFSKDPLDGLVSIPLEIEVIDRLEIISNHTKVRLIVWIVARKLLNGSLVWFFE